jgi:hypothetical protein
MSKNQFDAICYLTISPNKTTSLKKTTKTQFFFPFLSHLDQTAISNSVSPFSLAKFKFQPYPHPK